MKPNTLPKPEETRPNTNCLHGLACPSCGQTEPLKIIVETRTTFYDKGSDETEDMLWNDDSYCECPNCNFSGTTKDFYIDKKKGPLFRSLPRPNGH